MIVGLPIYSINASSAQAAVDIAAVLHRHACSLHRQSMQANHAQGIFVQGKTTQLTAKACNRDRGKLYMLAWCWNMMPHPDR